MEEKETVKEVQMLRKMEGMEDIRKKLEEIERDEESEVVHGGKSGRLRKDE